MARVLSTFSLAALLGGSGGDRAARPAPASAQAVAQARLASASLPRFALFGWVSPPNDSTTDARIAELAGAGLDVALPAWADSGRFEDNLRRIRYAADHGVRCLEDPALVAELRDLRGLYWFGNRAAWESYARSFIETVHPSVLVNNQYDFLVGSDRQQFVENAAAMRALSDEYGIPFWVIVLLVQHLQYRGLEDGELRWEVAQLLAYGARGVGYFTYWTPAPDPAFNWQPAIIGYDGTRTHWYDMLAAFNPRVLAAGEALAGLTWISTQHAGSVPRGGAPFAPDDWVRDVEGRAAIGRFAGGSGERYLLIANSDSLAPRTIVLSLPRTRRAWKQAVPAGSWSEVQAEPEALGVTQVRIALDAGDFALLKLERDPSAGPVLAVGPNPARFTVRFSVTGIGAGARLEILDTMGRRAWSSALTPGAGPFAWRGEREDGGRARPGIYFVRVTDASGVTTARFSWLGSR